MKRDKLIENLRNVCKFNDEEYKENLFSHLTDLGWWSDIYSTSDGDRERFLYEAFCNYYDIIFNGEVRETELVEGKEQELRYRLINKCKMQLDVELGRVKRGQYERVEE